AALTVGDGLTHRRLHRRVAGLAHVEAVAARVLLQAAELVGRADHQLGALTVGGGRAGLHEGTRIDALCDAVLLDTGHAHLRTVGGGLDQARLLVGTTLYQGVPIAPFAGQRTGLELI